VKRKRPPRLATWILDRSGDPYRRDSLVGDLIEEYQRGRSDAWYWWQVIRSIVASGGRRFSAALPFILKVLLWWSVLLAISLAGRWPAVIFALDPGVYWLLWRVQRKRWEKQGGRLVY
jgi:hypothetical protein